MRNTMKLVKHTKEREKKVYLGVMGRRDWYGIAYYRWTLGELISDNVQWPST